MPYYGRIKGKGYDPGVLRGKAVGDMPEWMKQEQPIGVIQGMGDVAGRLVDRAATPDPNVTPSNWMGIPQTKMVYIPQLDQYVEQPLTEDETIQAKTDWAMEYGGEMGVLKGLKGTGNVIKSLPKTKGVKDMGKIPKVEGGSLIDKVKSARHVLERRLNELSGIKSEFVIDGLPVEFNRSGDALMVMPYGPGYKVEVPLWDTAGLRSVFKETSPESVRATVNESADALKEKSKIRDLLRRHEFIVGDLEHVATGEHTRKQLNKVKGQGKKVYVRFGKVPEGEQSFNHKDNRIERGVSVYQAYKMPNNEVYLDLTDDQDVISSMFITGNTNRATFITGDVVGRGSDGEPLLRNVKTSKIPNNYKIKTLLDAPSSEWEFRVKSQAEEYLQSIK